MDKFYVTPKKSLVSNIRNGTNCRTSTEIFQTTSNSRRLGVGNICSKIRHKIEDNLTPKLSGKLYKTGKHSKSLSALSSIGASSGKYTLTNKTSAETSTAVADCRKVTLKSKIVSNNSASSNRKLSPYAECYEYNTSDIGSLSSSLLNYSDEDEDQLCLNIAKSSLEDEIFEELEKTSHDEHKLMSVLKTFDRIIVDYNDTAIAMNSATNINKNCIEMKTDKTENINPQTIIEYENEKTFCSARKSETSAFEQKKENCLEESSKKHTICGSPTLESNTNECNKLKKSLSTNSLTRKKCYQSPDSPCLRQMRQVFAQQQRSKSVWELSKVTKIPILKAIPLKTRSKSFSYSNFENSHHREGFYVQNSLKTPKIATNDQVLKSDQTLSLRNKIPVSNESKSQQNIPYALCPSIKSRNNAKLQNKTTSNSKFLQAKNSSNQTFASSSNCQSNGLKTLTVHVPHNKTSDELLDRCLEKGQQILQKVESLKTHRTQITSLSRKSLTRTKSNSNNKISKENLANKRKQWLQKLNYANEEKISVPSLESCKIIPPVLGETSDKHAELLVQVTNATQLIANKKLLLSQESQLSLIVHKKTSESEVLIKHQESDSDDSGHISNENMDTSINHTSNSSSSTSICEISSTTPSSVASPISDKCFSNCVDTKSLKMSEVLKKFERKASGKPQKKSCKTNTNKSSCLKPPLFDSNSKNTLDSRFCTTCRVAEVEPVSLIRTHVEIYPNYTKEVTIRLH